MAGHNGRAHRATLVNRLRARPPRSAIGSMIGKATLADHAADRPAAPEGRQKGTPKSVTIAYIAESAGVSVPTVSKVLNGKSGVSADTRARVEELINRYGYRKPPGANRSNVVELVFRELKDM